MQKAFLAYLSFYKEICGTTIRIRSDPDSQHCSKGHKDDIPAAVGPTKAPSAKEEVKMLETSE